MHARPLATAIAVALAPGLLLIAAAAQAAPDPADARSLDSVEVKGQIFYRDRTDEPATLVYDLEYFQRFEPLTVGDMLKRVPSVAFLSDVLEYDGVRLRGLDPGYTQILINGKRVPGGGFDRSFFVDRIPAELVERIEIIRSASADRSGDAVAGSLNIVLRDGYALEGGYIRAGGLHYNDDEFEPSVSAVWGGEALGGRLLLGANAQGRRNPKQKYSQRFDEPNGELDNTEVQTDVRSGEDYSFNADYSTEVGEGRLALNAYFVRTDRLQDEDSVEFVEGIETPDNIDVVNINDLDIRTDNWSIGSEYEFPMAGGETRIRFGLAGFDDRQDELEDEFEYLRDDLPFPDDDRFTGDRVVLDIEDREFSAELRHERDVADMKLKFGVDYTRKGRDTSILSARNRFNIPDAPAPRPTIPGDFNEFEAEPGGINTIDEDRVEPFVKLNGESGALEWQVGLRYQYTDLDIFDATVE
ncbi:TonB-dependent receptor plug domain-containing protein [Pseudomarimonas arenosa]|uniref:TonB-dependent receptor plug domain-containing protein n=1 Tax=Pseudomarimonas arenosa TaxID=2774145 RepID=UPI001CDBDA99|nr:TonB-dependent receptor plug domain-containing protein [Pseudomarimonas arenosa]